MATGDGRTGVRRRPERGTADPRTPTAEAGGAKHEGSMRACKHLGVGGGSGRGGGQDGQAARPVRGACEEGAAAIIRVSLSSLRPPSLLCT
jgi:hypothetical protein